MSEKTSSYRLELTALDGANPLAFLAAVGLVLLGDRMVGRGRWRLSWNIEVLATPVLHASTELSMDEVADVVLADRDRWVGSPSLEWNDIDDVKFASVEECRAYLEACAAADDGGRSLALATALVAEGGVDNNGASKPNDLHFTAGQQRFLKMARELRDGLTADDLSEALVDGWLYASERPSLKWDLTDDRIYALSASNPAKDTKLTVPGAEWLALQGLAALPVFALASGATRTTGCRGRWKSGGSYRWPLWSDPATSDGARALISHGDEARADALAGWGIGRLARSTIRRSDQGGYGSFAPSSAIWNADLSR